MRIAILPITVTYLTPKRGDLVLFENCPAGPTVSEVAVLIAYGSERMAGKLLRLGVGLRHSIRESS